MSAAPVTTIGASGSLFAAAAVVAIVCNAAGSSADDHSWKNTGVSGGVGIGGALCGAPCPIIPAHPASGPATPANRLTINNFRIPSSESRVPV